MPENNLGQL
jgi:hypothetical protein